MLVRLASLTKNEIHTKCLLRTGIKGPFSFCQKLQLFNEVGNVLSNTVGGPIAFIQISAVSPSSLSLSPPPPIFRV